MLSSTPPTASLSFRMNRGLSPDLHLHPSFCSFPSPAPATLAFMHVFEHPASSEASGTVLTVSSAWKVLMLVRSIQSSLPYFSQCRQEYRNPSRCFQLRQNQSKHRVTGETEGEENKMESRVFSQRLTPIATCVRQAVALKPPKMSMS